MKQNAIRERKERLVKIDKALLDNTLVMCLQLDSNRIRARYEKNWPYDSKGLTVRNNVRYWLVQHSSEKTDFDVYVFKPCQKQRKKTK